jgi:CRP/FNR family transcriptional regulator, cyclic AMP receptor protein
MRKVLYILGQLDDEDIEWMLTAGTRDHVSAGATLIREGQAVDAVYIVLEGALSVTTKANQGKEVAKLGAGEIIGEISFVDSRPPSATVVSTQESLVFRLDQARLSERLDTDTAFAARFYKALAVFLAGRLRSTTSRLGYSSGQSLDEGAEYEDELDLNVLDNVHLAGARFDRMVKRLSGAA